MGGIGQGTGGQEEGTETAGPKYQGGKEKGRGVAGGPEKI